MSFKVTYGGKNYFVDFKHYESGTRCFINEDYGDHKVCVGYGQARLTRPEFKYDEEGNAIGVSKKGDMLNKLYGRKTTLSRALDNMFFNIRDIGIVTKKDFKAFRKACYNAMFEVSKLHAQDYRFKPTVRVMRTM